MSVSSSQVTTAETTNTVSSVSTKTGQSTQSGGVKRTNQTIQKKTTNVNGIKSSKTSSGGDTSTVHTQDTVDEQTTAPHVPKKRRQTKKTSVPDFVTGQHEAIDIPDAFSRNLFTPRAHSSTMRIVSWNVNGLRALLKKPDVLKQYLEAEDPDILCLNETRIHDDQIKSLKLDEHIPAAYEFKYFNCSNEKKGYSGVAVLTKQKPISVEHGIQVDSHDGEGRSITIETKDCYVVAVYVPNSGMKLERLSYRTNEWDVAFRAYLSKLQTKKPVVLVGDLNVAHLEMDIHDPVKNRNKSPGFCDEERENFTKLLTETEFCDIWRQRNPKLQQFTFWGYRFNLRSKNKGWRLDYCLVSKALENHVSDVFVRSWMQGSDHVPIGIDIDTDNL